ncbi:phage tail assembly protein [Paractinoplanes rishiriensis]|uniref:phage tail assembly protein n=1 Tax=Paractinoplanes rishiriensis TaxID=1050105 RepID=UPI001EF18664|nr:phage tail assembly protein [Actinoplanes rishiriensis]
MDDIRCAAEAKYGSTDIDLGSRIVKLLNPLRLPKTRRLALVAVQEKLNTEGADQEALLSEALTLVAESSPAAKALMSAVGDDLAVLVEIFARYSEGTQAGEASPSAG